MSCTQSSSAISKDDPPRNSAILTNTNEDDPENHFQKRWTRAARRDPAIFERLRRLVATSENTDPTGMMVDADDIDPNVFDDDDYWETLELHVRCDPGPAHPGVYPGISRDTTMAIFAAHFNAPLTEQAQQEFDDIDSQEDFLDRAFDIGDVVRVKGSNANSWAKFFPAFGKEAWFSKETFEIVGLKLEGDLGIDDTDSELEAEQTIEIEDEMVQNNDKTKDGGKDIVIPLRTRQSSSTAEGIESYNGVSSSDDVMEDVSEPRLEWIYQLKPSKPSSDLFMADIMFFKEDNLVFDAEALDVEEEDASGSGTKIEAGEDTVSNIEAGDDLTGKEQIEAFKSAVLEEEEDIDWAEA